MGKTLPISIAVLFCVGLSIGTAKKGYESDVSKSQTETASNLTLDMSVNEDFNFNGSELEATRADAAECSIENPCKNGGTCSYRKRCGCPPGTSGDLCEEILNCSQCVNRLEVDCLYNLSKKESYCNCKGSSLYYDYDEKICKPCPCENGDCEYDSQNKLKCKCYKGYEEFNGYCKKCDCGYSAVVGCEFDSKGERICKCYDGFYHRNGVCLLCGCTMYSDVDTKCEMVGSAKRCFCREGLQDINGHCEDIDECEANNTCHPSTTCLNTYGSFYCMCPSRGYKGSFGINAKPGEVCEDVNECNEPYINCSSSNNVVCVNLLGSYKCECFEGYQPQRYDVEPSETTCFKTPKPWRTAVIVISVILVLLVVSGLIFIGLKYRATRFI